MFVVTHPMCSTASRHETAGEAEAVLETLESTWDMPGSLREVPIITWDTMASWEKTLLAPINGSQRSFHP